MNLANRLKIIVDENFKNIKSAAEALDVIPSVLSRYLNNRISPGVDFLVKVEKIGVNIHWLLTGNGKKYLDIELYTYLGELSELRALENSSIDYPEFILRSPRKYIFERKLKNISSSESPTYIIAIDSNIRIPNDIKVLQLKAFVRRQDSEEYELKDFQYTTTKPQANYMYIKDPNNEIVRGSNLAFGNKEPAYYILDGEIITENDFISKCQHLALFKVEEMNNLIG